MIGLRPRDDHIFLEMVNIVIHKLKDDKERTVNSPSMDIESLPFGSPPSKPSADLSRGPIKRPSSVYSRSNVVPTQPRPKIKEIILTGKDTRNTYNATHEPLSFDQRSLFHGRCSGPSRAEAGQHCSWTMTEVQSFQQRRETGS